MPGTSPVRLTGSHGLEAAYAREANAEELDAMKKMVREGMELGAIGFPDRVPVADPPSTPARPARLPHTMRSLN